MFLLTASGMFRAIFVLVALLYSIDPSVHFTGHTNNVVAKHAASKSSIYNSTDLLMSVPFYIYSEMDWLSEESLTTIGNYSFLDWLQLSAEQRQLPHKHDGDIKLYIAATQHPMRVYDPEEAKLFIVPSLTSLLQMNVVYV